MRKELQKHLRPAMRSNAVGAKRVAFAHDTHFNHDVRSSSIMKKRRVESKTDSKTDSARGDDGDNSDTTPILTEATSSGVDPDATPILDPSLTPVLDNQSSSGVDPEATPIIVDDQLSPYLDPEATPTLGSNSTPTVGGAASTNMIPEATSTSGSTLATLNNEQDGIEDLLKSVIAPPHVLIKAKTRCKPNIANKSAAFLCSRGHEQR